MHCTPLNNLKEQLSLFYAKKKNKSIALVPPVPNILSRKYTFKKVNSSNNNNNKSAGGILQNVNNNSSAVLSSRSNNEISKTPVQKKSSPLPVGQQKVTAHFSRFVSSTQKNASYSSKDSLSVLDEDLDDFEFPSSRVVSSNSTQISSVTTIKTKEFEKPTRVENQQNEVWPPAKTVQPKVSSTSVQSSFITPPRPKEIKKPIRLENQENEFRPPAQPAQPKSGSENKTESFTSSVLDESIDEYVSPASLDDLNKSVMSEICSTLEENREILKNNALLDALIKFRQKVLSRYEAAKKASPSVLCSSNWENHNRGIRQSTDMHNHISNESTSPSQQSGNSNLNSSSLTFTGNRFSDSFGEPTENPTPIRTPQNSVFQFGKNSYGTSENSATTRSPPTLASTGSQSVRKPCGESFDNLPLVISPNKVTGEAGSFYGQHQDDGASDRFKGYKFPHSDKMLQIFKNTFGLQKFRYNQLEAINAALLKEDCFILMPTGGGKSLCYQLPGVISEGVTVVVSPLRSLIMDQVQKLWSLDIPADSLSGDLNVSASNNIYRQLSTQPPGIKLLYVTPEKISASNKLISTLEGLYARKMLARFVIDEAHCVSEWGHDFRPDYKRLRVLKEKFPGVPMMALTATATARVRIDILRQLNMTSPKWFLQSFNRSNLKYEVRPKKGKSVVQDIVELIKSKFRNMSGIVYCLSRNDCDSIAAYLLKCGIQAVSYHAGLDNRNQVQETWFNDRSKVICATIAFGMGIDKPDVRFVIHHSLPKSMECYYQESGRAGRDGELSWCVLYYNYQDVSRIKRMIQSDDANRQTWTTHFNNLYKMVHYCENQTDCRRLQLLEYLGERSEKKLCTKNPKAMCDNCLSKDVFQNCDVTDDAMAIVRCLSDLIKTSRRKNYTLTYLIDIFKGAKTQKIMSAGHDKLPLHGRGSKYVRSDAERLMRKLVLDHYFEEKLVINHMDMTNSYVYLGSRAEELLTGKAKVIFAFKKGSKPINSSNATYEVEDKELNELSENCYRELIEVSKGLGSELNVHYTNIINVEALRQMSREMPMTEHEMLDIPHVTRAIYDKYGKKFLDVTQKYGAERSVTLAERVDKDVLNAILEDDEGVDNWTDATTYAPPKKYSKGYRKRKKTVKGGPPAKRKGSYSVRQNIIKRSIKNKIAASNKNKYFATQSKPKFTSSTNRPGFLSAPKPQNKAF